MPSAEKHGSLVPFASFRRPISLLRGEQVLSMEVNLDSYPYDPELESFQKLVFEQLNGLATVTTDEFLSISWVRELLDAFVICQEEFRVIMCNKKEQIFKTPLDRPISEFFERSVKALDICNATRDGIERIKMWQKHLDIVLLAFDSRQRIMGQSHFRRARKALMDLALLMLEEKEASSVFSHRNRSFGRRHNRSKDNNTHRPGHSRSLSWSVSNSWSAAKQLQSIAHNLVSPRGNEIAATNGLVISIFTMNYVLTFVLWALVAAFPCQDRGLQIHFSVPRQFSWGTPMFLLHARIMDEYKKRDRRNSNGLLKEINEIEKCVHRITNLVDSVEFPLTEEQKQEVRLGVQELSVVCKICNNGLDPLDRHLRDVFRKIMNCRSEGLEFLGKAH